MSHVVILSTRSWTESAEFDLHQEASAWLISAGMDAASRDGEIVEAQMVTLLHGGAELEYVIRITPGQLLREGSDGMRWARMRRDLAEQGMKIPALNIDRYFSDEEFGLAAVIGEDDVGNPIVWTQSGCRAVVMSIDLDFEGEDEAWRNR
jgi:hypothetical protein